MGRSRLHAMKNQHAFTLVELVITVTIVSILLGMALPSMTRFMAGQEMVGISNSLVSVLSLARSEAIKARVPATVCPSEDGSSCSGNLWAWNQGWMIYLDENRNGVYDADSDRKVSSLLLSANANAPVLETAALSVSFSELGYLNPFASNISMNVCKDGLDRQSFIKMMPTGSISVSRLYESC